MLDGKAKFLIRECKTKGITIIPLELYDIKILAKGADLGRIMKKKYMICFNCE